MIIIPGFLIALVTFPGVIVHEAAHLFFCKLRRVAVFDVCYFRIGNPSGYVIHEVPDSFTSSFLIAVGPFIINSFLCVLFCFPALVPVRMFNQPDPLCYFLIWLGISIGMHAFPSTQDAKVLWQQAKKAAANFNSPEGHIEQNGHVSGTIRYAGGETYVLKGAPATRDHSRGVRDLTRYKGHIWANGIFPSGKSFHLFTMKTHGFDDVAAGRAGAIVDGKLHEITLSRASQGWLESADQLFQPFKLSFESATLGRFEVDALELFNSVPLALTFPADHYWSVPTQSRLKNMTWVNEQKLMWRWNGETGYGHIERGNSRFASTDRAWISNFQRREIG